jgi:hypothetical protein
MKQNQHKVDLGIVYTMYGGIGYPGYYIDAEISKELFRLMRYYFRKVWRSICRSLSSTVAKIPALQNLL